MYLIDDVSTWRVFRNEFSLSMRLWKQYEILSKSIYYTGLKYHNTDDKWYLSNMHIEIMLEAIHQL